MNHQYGTVIRQLRELVPARPLTSREANSVAERQATKLLELLEVSEAPVEVSLVAELPRLRVVVRPSQELANLSGFSEWNKGLWTIAVNRDDSQTRRRFTLAHEFKHVLDHPFIRVMYVDTYGRPSAQRAEHACDYFAACLLIPRPWVKRLWAGGLQDQTQLASQFRVSPAAMGRRLADLGLSEPRRRDQTTESVSRYFRASLPLTRPSLVA